MTVFAATTYAGEPWNTNADMIVKLVELGYIRPDDRVLDPTYEKGTWWKKYRPVHLSYRRHTKHWDFRHTGLKSNSYDVIAFDPPYVCMGGRETSTLDDFTDRYGLIDAPMSPQELQQLINDGLTEMYRLIKPKGLILVKCQDYITSGKLFCATYHTQGHAEKLGLRLHDRLEHLGKGRAQPGDRRQVHARRNLSTLLVFQAPVARKKNHE